jgi:hypothetical protein
MTATLREEWRQMGWLERGEIIAFVLKWSPLILFACCYRLVLWLLGEEDSFWPSADIADKTEGES